ncbi:MAG TPA: ABC transporter permease [Cytophagales bacterium]|nr:ABC transporter permease [Cytophagales bacterium]HAA19219.1 ABC transporter permease [Cytophagales bacterium]
MLYILAWRNIWRNKRRTLITVASIGFAVFFASMLSSVQEGTFQRAIAGVVGQSLGFVQIHKQGYWDERTIDNSFAMTDALAKAVEEEQLGYSIVPRLESFALAAHGNQTKAAMVLGIDPEKEDPVTQISDKLVAGEMISADDQGVLLGSALADYLKVTVGDTLVLIGSGYHGANAAGKYAVKGLVKLNSPELNKQVLYLPVLAAQDLFAAYDLYTSITVNMEASDPIGRVQDQLLAQLDTSQYEVMIWTELAPELAGNIEIDRQSRSLMIFVLYVIIGFGIFGTFLMMTKERSYEFGVTIAIGMQRGRLIRVVLMEIVLLAVLGALAGALVAMPLTGILSLNPIPLTGDTAQMSEQFGQEAVVAFAFQPVFFLRQAVSIIFIALLLSIYPMWSIYRTQVVSAMRA